MRFGWDRYWDFEDGRGHVPAHRHPNGGGWVADTAQVDSDAFVASTAVVFGRARVMGTARICGASRISGRVLVDGNVSVGDTVADGLQEYRSAGWGRLRKFRNGVEVLVRPKRVTERDREMHRLYDRRRRQRLKQERAAA